MRARVGLALAAAVALAGCGGSSHPERDAVNAYFDRVDRAQSRLLASAGEIDRAFGSFRLTGNSPAEIRELELAETRIASALAGIRAIEPPAEARALHDDLVRMLSLERRTAHELVWTTRYQPRFTAAIAPLAGAGKTLAAEIKAAGGAKPKPAVPAGQEAGAAVWSDAGCGTCHTFAATGSNGSVGPSLDLLRPPASVVAAQVRAGGGGMPSFRKRLTRDQIAAVAAFVEAAASPAAATDAVLDAYAAAFAHYRTSLARILDDLRALAAPPELKATHDAVSRTLSRSAALCGSIAAALRKADVDAANAAIRRLFASTSTVNGARTRSEAATAVRAYNARLRTIAKLAARITRERERLVQQLG